MHITQGHCMTLFKMHEHPIIFFLVWYTVWDLTVGGGTEKFGNMTDLTNCTLIPRNTHITKELKELIENGNRKITLNVEITGELGPFGEQYPGGLFEPMKWILITEEAGKSLLLFPDDHVAKSLYTLSFGVSSLQLTVDQKPDNCLTRNYSLDQILNTIRFYVLRNFAEDENNVSGNFEVCNRWVSFEDDNKTGELEYICCNDVIESCYILKSGIWLNTLNICITVIKVMVPFLCPLFIPKRIFKTLSTFSYTPDPNHVESMQLLVKKVDVRHTLRGYTQIGIPLPEFKKFMACQSVGIHSIEVKSIQIEAKEDKLIEEGSHPFGFWNFLFKTFIECEMRKGDDNLNECCNQNMLKPFKCYISWIQFWKCVMYLLLCVVFLSPWWFTVIFYYIYDYQFVEVVDSASKALNVMIFVPLKDDFTTDYIMISTAFVFIILYNVTSDSFRFSIKTLFYVRIYGNNDFSQSLSFFVTRSLFPFKKFGLCGGCFVFVFWVVLAVPFLFLWFILQTLPLQSLFNNLFVLCQEIREVGKIIQISVFTLVFSLFIVGEAICISVYVVTGCVIFYMDCFVYSMIGLLLNYNYVFKYVCLILLFLVYGYSCFNKVHQRYSYFSKLLSRKIQAKVVSELKDLGCRDTEDVNGPQDPMYTAHVMSSFSTQQHREICFAYLPGSCLYWRAKRLVFFLDRSEAIPTSYISKQFFQDMNSIPSLVCPGSPYILYLKAFRDFILVALFLLFVIIVVFALGRAHDLSSGVQTILALGGGLSPFVFEKFFSNSHIKIMSEIENSLWEKMLENKIDFFEERWKVLDIEVRVINGTGTAVESSVRTEAVCRQRGSIQVGPSDTNDYDFVVSEETTKAGTVLNVFVPTVSIEMEAETVVHKRSGYESLA